MKYCSKCGTPLAENARFCPACGEPISAESSATARATAPAISLSTLALGGALLCLVGGGGYLVGASARSKSELAHNEVIEVDSSGLPMVEAARTSGDSGSNPGQPQSNPVPISGGIDQQTETRARENAMRSSCQSNLKQIALGIKQYVQDYDEKLPTLTSGNASDGDESAQGWAHNLQPYLKSTQIFQCPAEANPSNSEPSQAGYTDYYFNRALAGQKEVSLDYAANTIINGDGISSDALYNRTERETAGEPGADVRHLGGANYAFEDGHVKWLRPSRVEPSSVAPDGSNATFGTGIR